MNFRRSSLLLLSLCLSVSVFAQDKTVSLEEIWNGKFSQDRLQSLRSLQNGEEYTVLEYDRPAKAMKVNAYSYKTGQQTETLIDSREIDGIDQFMTYNFSEDENKAIISTEVEPIYRRSSRGRYYVYNIEKDELTPIADKKIKEPSFSPDGSKVAYAYKNNIYYKNLKTGKTTQVTTDGEMNAIINGTTDWVYEEEFAFVQAFEWNKTGTKIAFLRFDERQVPEFSMDKFGHYGDHLYPQQEVFKYPKAGEKNSDVSLHMYDVKSGDLSKVDLENDYEYLPRIKWTNDKNILSVQALNRHQNDLDLIFVNADDKNSSKVVLDETDDAYISISDDLTFLNDNSFIWTSEKDGWNHIYHYDKNGDLINQVTDGDWTVTAYYGFDPKTGRIYFQSTENGSINRDVYSITASGKNKVQLSRKRGTNSADFSADFTYFINTFNSATSPYEFSVHKALNGKKVRDIKDNSALENRLDNYKISPKKFSTIDINDEDLNMWMIKPEDFDSDKEYPLLMFQYSGPGSQQVSNSFFSANDYWYQMLANKYGYIIACVDGRGTGFKGAEFKKMTQLELGKYEVEDQIDAAKKLSDRDYIDSDRTGIWGWSFGGFMASNAILQGNDTFELAIAVAPVISWRYYDTIYTERYMTTPQENPEGYDQNSPITHASKLEGDYLLVHGGGDDNVHVQNSMEMIQALIKNNKDFDMAIYPDRTHGIYEGQNTRLHLYTKMTDFITENL